MGTISEKKLEFVKNLYFKKLYSAREVADVLNISIDAVYYFMRRQDIKRRGLSEQNKIVFERKPISFRVKSKLSQEDQKLKTVGVVLYWGEGYKAASSAGIDFTNSDPHMIAVFTHFLRRICGVNPDRLRVLLYCYSNQDVTKLIQFWSSLTNIPKKQFTKPYVRQNFKGKGIGKMPHGLVHIRYMDKKLLILMREWIGEYKKQYASVVERSNTRVCKTRA